MGLLSLVSPSTTPAVRRPAFDVSFGSDGSDKWAGALVSITVESTLAPGVDVAEIRLANEARAPGASVDDAGSISLGFDSDSVELVFTGKVDSLRHSVQGPTRVIATNAGATLARLRLNQSYEQQKAGEVVNDLAGRAGSDIGKIEDGIDLPFLALDDRRSAYAHIAALAKRSGFAAFYDAGGALNFQPTGGAAVQTFTYGQDILALEGPDASPFIGSVTTIGEGAAGSQGNSAASWFIKDPSAVKGTAGSGDPERLVIDPVLRSASAASQSAQSILAGADQVRLTGTLLVPGAPKVLAGSSIEIASAPQDILNGVCLVRAVRHRYTKTEGFTSLILFAKSGDSAGGIGGLLGGLL